MPWATTWARTGWSRSARHQSGTSQAHTYDAENRLVDTNAVANSFDANGNLIAKGFSGYAYDEENRLIQTTINSTTTQYGYDGLGNRYSRTRGGNTTRYVLDTNTALTNVLVETDSLGTVQAYNVYGQGLIARILPDNTTHYYHYDSRGSTVALTDTAETVTDSYAYDPFGKPVATTGSNANSFRYLGRHGVQDEGDNLNYIRARYYDTDQQRFASKDPYLGDMRHTQSLNRYAYAINNPVRMIDVTGYNSVSDFLSDVTDAAESLAKATVKKIEENILFGSDVNLLDVVKSGVSSFVTTKVLDEIEGEGKTVPYTWLIPVPFIKTILFRYHVTGEEIDEYGNVYSDGQYLNNKHDERTIEPNTSGPQCTLRAIESSSDDLQCTTVMPDVPEIREIHVSMKFAKK